MALKSLAEVYFEQKRFQEVVETYKQASYMFAAPVKGLTAIDGYQLVLKASALQNDPAMEFT